MRVIAIASEKFRMWVFAIILLGGLINVSAQKPSDFSGTWKMDFGRSDTDYGKYYSVLECVIVQSPQAITVERTSTDKSGKQSKQDPVTCSLDGKEIAKEKFGGIDKYSASWSADKKSLIIKYVRTSNGADYGSNEAYSLSGDGKVLTIRVTDLKGESPISEMIYNKK